MLKPKPKLKKHGERLQSRPVEEPEESEEEDVTEEPEESALLDIDGATIQAQIQKMLRLRVFTPEQRFWLDTRSPELNGVFGSRDRGIPYGKMIEISGLEHCGKTLIATVLMGLAQQDGAAVGYIDLEDSRDEKWATKLGVHWPGVVQFYPELVLYKEQTEEQAAKAAARAKTAKEKKDVKLRQLAIPKLLSAEQVFEEAERAMHLLAQRGVQKQFWFVDSVAGIETAKQQSAGVSDATMNSKLDRAAFLSTLLPHWVGLGANYNATVCWSNQLRANMSGYGDDETTGGRALRHFCAVRVRGRRVKGGRLKNGKTIVGLAGIFSNRKNKAGEGSVEGDEVGFKIRWDRPIAKASFMGVDDLKEDMGEK